MKYYIDGSTYPQNPGLGGAGIVVIGRTQDHIQGIFLGENITNNEAETLAVFHALEFAITYKDPQFILYSDSAYVGYGMNRVLQNRPLLKTNFQIWTDIYALVVNSDMKIFINFVPSHKGVIENEVADVLAWLGANELEYKKFIRKGTLYDTREELKREKKIRTSGAQLRSMGFSTS